MTPGGSSWGTPADLMAARSTLTGEHLAAFVGPEAVALPRSAPTESCHFVWRDLQ